jgi:4'-phosphopantetheinyl transferase
LSLQKQDSWIPGRVWVYQTPVSAAVPELAVLLNHTELKRFRSYQKEEDQKRSLLSFALLRLLLSRITGKDPRKIKISRDCPSCGKPHGKPRVTDEGPVEVNISHSGKWVLTAIAFHTPVGIDIEQIHPELVESEMVKRVLSAEEMSEWEKLPPGERKEAFYRYWTWKEAILKATGEGLAVPMTRLTVTNRDGSPQLTRWEGREDRVGHIRCHPLEVDPQYAACLAVIGRAEEVLLRQGEEIIQAWLKNQNAWTAR